MFNFHLCDALTLCLFSDLYTFRTYWINMKVKLKTWWYQYRVEKTCIFIKCETTTLSKVHAYVSSVLNNICLNQFLFLLNCCLFAGEIILTGDFCYFAIIKFLAIDLTLKNCRLACNWIWRMMPLYVIVNVGKLGIVTVHIRLSAAVSLSCTLTSMSPVPPCVLMTTGAFGGVLMDSLYLVCVQRQKILFFSVYIQGTLSGQEKWEWMGL